MDVVALCDGGSSGLIASKRLVETLGVGLWSEMMTVRVLDQTTHSLRDNCLLTLVSKATPLLLPSCQAAVVESIPIAASTIPNSQTPKQYEHMKDVVIEDPPYAEVDLIIGIDMAYTFAAPTQVRRGATNLPMGIFNEWGWSLLGGAKGCHTVLQSYLVTWDDTQLSHQLSRLWEIDFQPLPGDDDLERHSQGELKALKIIESSLRLVNGQYESAAPWKQSRLQTKKMMQMIDSGRTAKNGF